MFRVINMKKAEILDEKYSIYARKPCLITTLENGIKKDFYKFFDEEEIVSYIENYENYLINKKNRAMEKEKQRTFDERIRKNIKALPAYLIALVMLFFACISNLIVGATLFFLAFGLTILTASIANETISDEKLNALPQVKELNQKLEEVEELYQISKEEIENSYRNTMMRKRLDDFAKKSKRSFSKSAWEEAISDIIYASRDIRDAFNEPNKDYEEKATRRR